MTDEDRTTQPFRVWWDETNSIGRTEWAAGSVCTLPEAQAVLGSIAALGRGKIPVLVDIRQARSIDRPARELLSRTGDHFTSAALLADSAVTRMVANFFLGLNRSLHPVRMFTSEAAAVSWLRTQP